MSRKKYERGISYDEERQLWYLYMDLGKGEDGRRQRQYRTYPSLAAARKARDEFLTERAKAQVILPAEMTLDDWLEEWMKEIIIPNRAETTVYGYREIIKNHLSPALGDVPL